MSRRTDKVGSQLRDELARLLREEATDPRIGLVTITRVDVSPDLSNALVYYSVMDAELEDAAALTQVDDGLASAAAFLRRRLARLLPLRRVPELRFRFDPSLALGSRTLSLLHDLEGKTSGTSAEDSAVPSEGSRRDDETA